eukprot:TRINITY_DN3158_c0_g1_i1.p1 TRINITY_DN3158_c0_g1~~TRINITY_DN3158_c0_g1_i1.p1  ORF type:complete len:293 (+),score=109.04 TRINITY_DN3158_c0_g1_i1:23-901(+)
MIGRSCTATVNDHSYEQMLSNIVGIVVLVALCGGFFVFMKKLSKQPLRTGKQQPIDSLILKKKSVSSFKTIKSGKWLNLGSVDDENGVNWEVVKRTTRVEGKDVDGVDVVPILRYPSKALMKSAAASFIPRKSWFYDFQYFVLGLCYRAAANGYVLEFPSGLIDEGESVDEAALRELKEETGFIGEMEDSADEKPVMFSDPWKSNESSKFVWISIDGNRKENVRPKQELEAEEDIKIVLMPVGGFREAIVRLAKEKNVRIDARLWTFAEGMAAQEKMKNIMNNVKDWKMKPF